MKKILALVLVLAMFVLTCGISTGALSIEETIAEEFFDFCGGNEKNTYLGTNPNVTVYEYIQSDSVLFFSAVASWMGSDTMECKDQLGKWSICSPATNNPSPLGLYAMIGTKIYTIEDAWEMKLITDLTPIEAFSKYSVVTSVSNSELSQKFYDYCVETLSEDMQPVEGDNVRINLEYEIDGITCFSARTWHHYDYTGATATFGDVNIYSKIKYQPYELGIYVANGDEIYTLEEAYNAALITDLSVLEDAFCGWYVFYEDYVPNPENKYESDIVQKVLSPGSWSQDGFDMTYKEVFEYFADTNASFDEATPNYALIYVRVPMVTDAPEAYIFGDYVLQSTSGYTPFSFGYCIYIPATGEVYSLIKAYEMGIDGIEKVFTETNIGRRLGDMDKDRKITVKDATYIQKIVAGFEGYSHGGIYTANFDESLPSAIADFNRDRETNIKDATAIQKYIAGITE